MKNPDIQQLHDRIGLFSEDQVICRSDWACSIHKKGVQQVRFMCNVGPWKKRMAWAENRHSVEKYERTEKVGENEMTHSGIHLKSIMGDACSPFRRYQPRFYVSLSGRKIIFIYIDIPDGGIESLLTS
jgi:hypothetical protein